MVTVQLINQSRYLFNLFYDSITIQKQNIKAETRKIGHDRSATLQHTKVQSNKDNTPKKVEVALMFDSSNKVIYLLISFVFNVKYSQPFLIFK